MSCDADSKDPHSKNELEEARRAIGSIIHKCEKAQEKFSKGTSQHTLLKNRLKAMYLSTSLIEQELQKVDATSYCKMEIFIPETHLSLLREALQRVDAGHIGKYDSCLSYSHVTGCWRPLECSNPYLGTLGRVSEEKELKVEVTCLRQQVEETIAAVKQVHPYEEPVINVIPLYRTSF